jgi:hypothetical protein
LIVRPRARTKSVGRGKLAELGIRPAALAVDEAAAYCGLSAAQFLKEVAAGTLPAPIGGLLSKRKLWSLRALERIFDGANDDVAWLAGVKAPAHRPAEGTIAAVIAEYTRTTMLGVDDKVGKRGASILLHQKPLDDLRAQ